MAAWDNAAFDAQWQLWANTTGAGISLPRRFLTFDRSDLCTLAALNHVGIAIGREPPVSYPNLNNAANPLYRFAAFCVHSRGSGYQQGMPASGQTGACVALAIVRFRAHWVSAAIRAKPSRIMTG